MGYSCSAKAGFTLDAIEHLIGRQCSNEMPDGGFWETGREQSDGAITGSVWKPYPADTTKSMLRGYFRIAADGRIIRFPGLPATLQRQAEEAGAKSYRRDHGTWRERAAPFLAGLESGAIIGAESWTWFESIQREWQTEMKIMFAVMPAATNEAMAEALRGMLTEGVTA